MAGLIRAGSGGRTRGNLPLFPSPSTVFQPHYEQEQSEGAYVHIPGFAGGTAGRSIRILSNSATSFGATIYNIDGTTSSDGVWASGITIAEGAGSSNADQFVGCYMDETDQVLYMLFNDTSTNPNTFYFSKVNEAGTVTAIGNQALGGSGLNSMNHSAWYTGNLRRKGGDGSGNFAIVNTNMKDMSQSGAPPYRGSEITINASTGAVSHGMIMGYTYGSHNAHYAPHLGPSDNGIMASAQYSRGTTYVGYGSLLNRNNDKSLYYCNFGSPVTNGFPSSGSAGGAFRAMRARSHYFFYLFAGSIYGASSYHEDEVHAWLDEMAVYRGIL